MVMRQALDTCFTSTKDALIFMSASSPNMQKRSINALKLDWRVIETRLERDMNVPMFRLRTHMCVHDDPGTIDCSVATEWWRMQKSSVNFEVGS
jgi:hypothetical protein